MDVHSVFLCESCNEAQNIQLPEDGLRTKTCRNVFNVLMCKFYKLYICAVVGVIIECYKVFHFTTYVSDIHTVTLYPIHSACRNWRRREIVTFIRARV